MASRQEEPFDPLDYGNIARAVVDHLLAQPMVGLGELEPFDGAGIYALYYMGASPAYERVAASTPEVPLYVGKAVPPGARHGRNELNPPLAPDLYRRLGEHARSIEQAENLRLEDFLCRYLVVKHYWIRLAEQVLLQEFRPLWNRILDGFGNHPPGRGRRNMRRPRWDVVHPGRPWAAELRQEDDPQALLAEIRRHFETAPPGSRQD